MSFVLGLFRTGNDKCLKLLTIIIIIIIWVGGNNLSSRMYIEESTLGGGCSTDFKCGLNLLE